MVWSRTQCRGHRRVRVNAVRSFDASRPRSAPASIRGVSLSGEALDYRFAALTLVVAIKANCDGCATFTSGPLEDFDQLNVVLITKGAELDEAWSSATYPIVISPEAFEELEISSPPFYALVDAHQQRVICEGVVFGPQQVATEIAPYLTH